MKRITNRHAGAHAGAHTPFQGSNLYGEALPGGGFVVYSYGPHWPLYVWDGCQWYENADRYSNSTTRHAAAAHPYTSSGGYLPTLKCSCRELRDLVDTLTGQRRLTFAA